MSAEVFGVVEVKIVSAYGVINTDAKGKSDPYCVLHLGSHQLTKTSVEKDTLSPVWNHLYTFVLCGSISNSEKLLFEVYDKDRFTKDDFMGKIEIPLIDIVNNCVTGNTHMLESREFRIDKVAGSITVETQFMKVENKSSVDRKLPAWHFQNGKLHAGLI
mmetsp:Transcript_2180/g.3842  ORF Transcript_2180/g.3842 Transcript_2180/m.3842 type:complete len:160 (-) Transcript_2180:1257-1736(-)